MKPVYWSMSHNNERCWCSLDIISIIVPPQKNNQSRCNLTRNCVSLWQDGDSADGSILEALNRAVLGSPTIRPNPQEMAHLIRSFTGVKDPPANIPTHGTITMTLRPSVTLQESRRAIAMASRLNRYRE